MIATDVEDLLWKVHEIQEKISRLEFELAEEKIRLARLMAEAALKAD